VGTILPLTQLGLAWPSRLGGLAEQLLQLRGRSGIRLLQLRKYTKER